MIVLDGLEYVPTSVACERLGGDVTGETLRNWYHPRGGRTPTVRLLLAPDGIPVRWHRQMLVCWPDVVEAEHATRRRHRRPRESG